MNKQEIISLAKKEIAEEDLRRAIESMKVKLRTKKSIWDFIWPWKIVVVRKDTI